MVIRQLNGGAPLAQMKDNNATVELTYKDVSDIARSLYKMMSRDESVKKLYSDFMILHQLLETGTLDDWTVERVAIHRGVIETEKKE